MKFSRKQILENAARLKDRDRLYRRHGYDSLKAGQFVLKHAGPLPGRVLEIGTGKGRFLVQLAKRSARVVTVDPDAAEQRFARMNAAHGGVSRKIRFVAADGARLPFADASFDAVVSMNALHHIRDLDGVLDEALRVVKPGGKIVLADFDKQGFRIFDRIHAAEGRVHHRCPYRWDRIVSRLRRAGGGVKRVQGQRLELVVDTVRKGETSR